MFAVVKTGGQQFKVAKGDKIRVNYMKDAKAGDKIKLEEVLMVGGSTPKVGAPLVGGASVEATVAGHERGDKVIVFNFRRRKNSMKKNGHVQKYTVLEINGIKG
jgi:large subunit ribosomal protein L21